MFAAFFLAAVLFTTDSIQIGFPAARVQAAWGAPDSKHKYVGLTGEYELWEYREISWKRGARTVKYRSVYLKNGVVIEFSNFK